MAKRTAPDDLTPEERKAWAQAHKNRNLHSIKLTDEMEAKYQAWKLARNIRTDNQALRLIIETHPEF